MPEIGSTLREARMRAKIDITEVEQATKIRAKYLRAIENEEWSLLPGSTFIKSFIREYAEYLGLDGRSLVEEYKLRYELPSDHELRSVGTGFGRGGRGSAGRAAGDGGLPRWAITTSLVVVLLVALYLVGSLGGSEEGGSGESAATQPRTTEPAGAAGPDVGEREPPRRVEPVRTEAGIRLIPTGEVYVCLVAEDGTVLIPGTIFGPGDAIPLRRAPAMRLTLGNGNVEMRVNGRPFEVPASPNPLGYAITPRGVEPLPEEQRPTCTP